MIPPPTLPVKVPASASGNSDFKQANSGFTCIFYSKVYNYSMNGKKLRNLAKTFGNLFVDLGKLSFGSLMLGTLLKGGVDLFQLFLFGAGLAMISFAVGIWFMSISEE